MFSMGVDGTGSGSCQLQALVLAALNLLILLAESLLFSKLDIREIGFEDSRWMELAQDRVKFLGIHIPSADCSSFAAQHLLHLSQI